MNDIQLYKPNELINFFSQLELNRNARHLFNYFLQYAQQQIKFKGYQGNTFRINVTQLNNVASIKHKDYKDLEKSLLRLISPIVIRDNPKKVSIFSAVRKVYIDYEQGEYVYMLEDEILQLLSNNNYFTKLNLQEFNPLGKHSIVIFEFLKRYENAPKIPLLTVEDLRKMTSTIDKKTYDNFSHIKNNILDVAQEEINSLTSYNFEYTPIKEKAYRRPKVTAVQFYFSKKENTQEVIDVQSTDNNQVQAEHITQQQTQQNNDSVTNTYLNTYEFSVFSRVFKGFTVEEFILTTYKYTYQTIKLFADAMSKYSTQKYDLACFKRWLRDRCIQYDNHNERGRTFATTEDIYKLFGMEKTIQGDGYYIDDDIYKAIQKYNMFNLFGKLEYKDYCVVLRDAYNMAIHPIDGYNPFQKMLDEMR